MRFRIKSVVIPLALVAAGSGIVDGKHTRLMAQNQDLTQAQKDDRCQTIRRVLMGKDGTGMTSGLRYERSRLEAIIQLLQKESEAVQQENSMAQSVSMEAVDKEIAADLAMLKGAAPGWQHEEIYNLAVRDLFYWTALKLRKKQLAKGYGGFLPQALAQEQQRLRAINSNIANENDVADALHCQAFWASHPVQLEPQIASSTTAAALTCLDTTKPARPEDIVVPPDRKACCDHSYTDAYSRQVCYFQNITGRTYESIKVVGSFQCELNETETGPLGGGVFIFSPAAGGGDVKVGLNSGSVGQAWLPAGTYTLKMPKTISKVPQFGDAKVLWAQVRVLGGPGKKYAATSDEGNISVTFGHINASDRYEVEVRVSSLHLCSQ
jgi:hypothetical protein